MENHGHLANGDSSSESTESSTSVPVEHSVISKMMDKLSEMDTKINKLANTEDGDDDGVIVYHTIYDDNTTSLGACVKPDVIKLIPR